MGGGNKEKREEREGKQRKEKENRGKRWNLFVSASFELKEKNIIFFPLTAMSFFPPLKR